MIFGLGTSPCGTQNLAKLLDLPHERFWLPWRVNETLLSHYVSSFKEFGGNVGLYLLNYVGCLHDEFPDAKFVCLQRDMFLTVRSLVKKLHGRNVFSDEKARAGFHFAYPEYPGMELKQSAERYWREYYLEAHRLQVLLPDHFRVYSTAWGLGEGVDYLLDFCGYERTKQA